MSELGTTDDVQSIIQSISYCIDEKEESEHGIKRLGEIKEFIN